MLQEHFQECRQRLSVMVKTGKDDEGLCDRWFKTTLSEPKDQS